MTNATLNICPCECTCGVSCDHKTCPCKACVDKTTPLDEKTRLDVVAHIHEEDVVVLRAEDAHALANSIREKMYNYQYNSQGSDYICVFCQNRGRGKDDQIEHEDVCDGKRFLKMLGEE
ncbi:MAG: hypothetical protein ACRD6W_19680 [Nitrososphaerales archaeon]